MDKGSYLPKLVARISYYIRLILSVKKKAVKVRLILVRGACSGRHRMDEIDSLAFRVFVVAACGGLGAFTLASLTIAVALWRQNRGAGVTNRR